MYVIPVRELGSGQGDLIKAANRIVLRTASFRLAAITGKEQSEAFIRDLLPGDLGLNDWHISGSGIDKLWVTCNVPENKVFMFYKIMQLGANPTVDQITFLTQNPPVMKASTGLRNLYIVLPILKNMPSLGLTIEQIREVLKILPSSLAMEGYFNHPINYDPQELLSIVLNISEEGDNEIVLGGFVIETV